MPAIVKEYKHQLGLLLASGHARFGKVAARRPYREEDEGGEGAAGLLPEHPLLGNVPIGAASDLTAIASANSQAKEEALERVDELTPALKQKPELRAELQLQQQPRYTPKPSPF